MPRNIIFVRISDIKGVGWGGTRLIQQLIEILDGINKMLLPINLFYQSINCINWSSQIFSHEIAFAHLQKRANTKSRNFK